MMVVDYHKCPLSEIQQQKGVTCCQRGQVLEHRLTDSILSFFFVGEGLVDTYSGKKNYV